MPIYLQQSESELVKLTPEQCQSLLGFTYYDSIRINGQVIPLPNQVPMEHLPKLIIRRISDEVGYGVFAGENIPASAQLGYYAGDLKTVAQVQDDTYTMIAQAGTTKLNSDSLVMDAKDGGNIVRMFQHLPDNDECQYLDPAVRNSVAKENLTYSNVTVDLGSQEIDVMRMRTGRDIQKGEQLGWSYGEYYWQTKGYFPLTFDKTTGQPLTAITSPARERSISLSFPSPSMGPSVTMEASVESLRASASNCEYGLLAGEADDIYYAFEFKPLIEQAQAKPSASKLKGTLLSIEQVMQRMKNEAAAAVAKLQQASAPLAEVEGLLKEATRHYNTCIPVWTKVATQVSVPAHSEYAKLLCHIGQVLQKQGKHSESLRYFDKAFSLQVQTTASETLTAKNSLMREAVSSVIRYSQSSTVSNVNSSQQPAIRQTASSSTSQRVSP